VFEIKKVNIPALLLAILVITMLVFAGFAISSQNIWLILLFLVLGFAFMIFGLKLKKKRGW